MSVMGVGSLAMDTSKLPQFVFAGFPRTGSQFTMRCLRLHPEIDFVPKPRFFVVDANYAKGPAHYGGLFARCSEARLIGEGDEHYLSGEPRFADPFVVAERIHAVVPDARILITIRNQVDFLLSGFRYWKRSGLSAPFSDFMNGWPEDGVAFARIADFHPFVLRYVTLFGPDRVHVQLHEDLARDVRSFLGGMYSFLGVSTECIDEVTAQISAYTDVNPAPSRVLSRLLDLANSIRMRNPRRYRWIFPVRLYRLLATTEYRLFGSSASGYRQTLSEDETQAIRARYGQGNRQLSRLLGMDLEAAGYPV